MLLKLMIHYLIEICEFWLKYLRPTMPVPVYGDGSGGTTDTNRAFRMSIDLESEHLEHVSEGVPPQKSCPRSRSWYWI
jgi:hypothetical protein